MYDYGGLGLQFWKDLGAMIRREDPIATPSACTTRRPAGRRRDGRLRAVVHGPVLHNEPWLDFNDSQPGHGKWRNELVPRIVLSDYARMPAKPMVITETWYEFDERQRAGHGCPLRRVVGNSLRRGRPHLWRRPPVVGRHTRSGTPRCPAPGQLAHRAGDVDTLDYPGAVSMGYMAKFLKGIEWWKLEPHPELVSEYPQPLAPPSPGRSTCCMSAREAH